jgi:hypothetical protein
MKRLAILLFTTLGTGALQASVIYSNFGGPAPGFDPTSGNTVASSGTDFSPSFMFTVPVAPGVNNGFVLTEIDFVASNADAFNIVSATISLDNGGLPGVAVFTTGAIVGQMSALGNATELTFLVNAGPFLASSQNYWLTLDAPTDTTVVWNYNGLETDSTEAFLFNGDLTTAPRQEGAYEVQGTPAVAPTPEPATMALFATGLIGLAVGRSRRKLG